MRHFTWSRKFIDALHTDYVSPPQTPRPLLPTGKAANNHQDAKNESLEAGARVIYAKQKAADAIIPGVLNRRLVPTGPNHLPGQSLPRNPKPKVQVAPAWKDVGPHGKPVPDEDEEPELLDVDAEDFADKIQETLRSAQNVVQQMPEVCSASQLHM